MNTNFSQQIDYLLFTGAIEGAALLELYHLLKSHQQGLIDDRDLQVIINEFDPEWFWQSRSSGSSDLA